jgi:hypothetical protein
MRLENPPPMPAHRPLIFGKATLKAVSGVLMDDSASTVSHLTH